MRRTMKFSFLKVFIAVVLLFTVAISCQSTIESEFEDIPVVEGFLFNDSTVNIKISKLIPFRDDVSYSDEDISKLDITISDITMGLDYTLVHQDSGIYVGRPDFIPEIGHTYRLRFDYNGSEITAETKIPDVAQNVVLSDSVLTVQSFTGGGFPTGGRMMDSITVSWDNPNRDYYFILIENKEANPESIYGNLGNGNASPRLIRTQLTQESSVRLQSMQFNYLGRHVVHVCRVQPEYVTLLQHNSETLVEIFANVKGGFGIFTGIGDFSTELIIKRED